MRDATIREAKAGLTSLVHEAESGRPVRLTRRGKPVAMLISDRQYASMKAGRQSRPDFLRFLQGWRREMIAKGLPFVSRQEIAAMRDRSPGRDFYFDK